MRSVYSTPLAFVLLLLTLAGQARAADATPNTADGFSFAAFGDSRPMLYLPFKQGQPQPYNLFVDLFGLVLPQKVSEEVVKKYCKFIYDPVANAALLRKDLGSARHHRLEVSPNAGTVSSPSRPGGYLTRGRAPGQLPKLGVEGSNPFRRSSRCPSPGGEVTCSSSRMCGLVCSSVAKGEAWPASRSPRTRVWKTL
jgi:hypothetical protein